MTEGEKNDRSFYVNTALKVGGVIAGAYFIKSLFTTPKGRTDRLKFDLEKTQNRYMPTGNPPPNDFVVIADPWTPADIALKLHTEMNGVTIFGENITELYRELQRMGKDRARYLHNYWLDKIDSDDTLYRWITAERTTSVTEEIEQRQIEDLFRSWGIGF
jgi:hypothetical protein